MYNQAVHWNRYINFYSVYRLTTPSTQSLSQTSEPPPYWQPSVWYWGTLPTCILNFKCEYLISHWSPPKWFNTPGKAIATRILESIKSFLGKVYETRNAGSKFRGLAAPSPQNLSQTSQLPPYWWPSMWYWRPNPSCLPSYMIDLQMRISQLLGIQQKWFNASGKAIATRILESI